jgi:TonB family protein
MPDLLIAILKANLVAAAAILLVLLVRHPVRRAFGARIAYALWIGPLLAALASFAPAGPAGLAAPVILEAGGAAGGAVRDGLAATPWTALIFFAAWIAGAVGCAALLWRRQASFMAALGRLEPVARGVWRAERAGIGPALVGALRPRIITPADFETRFAPKEREVILAHEAAHLAGRDPAINAAVAAAQCLCWFNPLVHLAVPRLRIDQELACDAAVLRRFPKARRLYGELLLRTQLATRPLPLGCHWPPGSEHPLKERIVMLQHRLPGPARRAAGAAVIGALSLVAVGAAWAASSPAEAIQTPKWVERPDPSDLERIRPSDPRLGRVVMTCTVDGEGMLRDCKVVKEDPEKVGFGPAVLALAQKFRMEPRDAGGTAVAGRQVHIPVMFSAAPAN